MTTYTLLLLIIIGLAAGFFSGMIGLGGAIIIIPALIYLLGMNQFQAQGTSLAVMLPPIGLLAAWNYYKAGHINLKFSLIIAAAFFLGAYLGSGFTLQLPVLTVKRIFGLVIVIIGLSMVMARK